VIEPTDEMVQLALDVFLTTPTDSIAQIDAGMRNALAAALAIVERDYAIGAVMCDQPHPTESGTYCELIFGHAEQSGRGHSATVTKAVDW
jgi:hypothetical protein